MVRTRWGLQLALAGIFAVATACGGADEQAADDAVPAEDTATQAAPAPDGATTANLPPGATQEMVAQGQQIFTGNGICYTCHGQNAEGTQLAPNLRDSEWLWVDASSPQAKLTSIENTVRTGVATPKQHPSPMPAMGGAQLSDDQVRAVSAYVYSLSGS